MPVRPQVNSGRGRPEWDLSCGSNLTLRRLSYGSNSTPHHLSYGSNGVAQLGREQKAHDEKIVVVATIEAAKSELETEIAIICCALAACRNNSCAFDHQDDSFFWSACAMNYSARDCEALLGH
jgi:hypothetical protein